MTTTTSKAAGTFTVDSWDEELFDEAAEAKLGRTRLTKTFSGDLVGTSMVTMLAVSVPGDGGEYQGAAYVAVERVTGSLHGKQGSFVLAHVGSEPHGFKVAVVPGSGGGDLAGITGEIAISRHEDGSHTYVFGYELG